MTHQTVSAFARRFGLSRSTLLYYDRIGLLKPAEQTSAGYRLYGPDEVARMMRIETFRQAGLALKDIQKILDGDSGDALEQALEQRLVTLNAEIAALHAQQRLIARLLQRDQQKAGYMRVDANKWVEMLEEAGVDEAGRKRWHRAFERDAPEVHHGFLAMLGFDAEKIAEIRRKSRES